MIDDKHRYTGPFIVMINNALPMARLYKNIYNKIDNICPFCSMDFVDDQIHFWICPTNHHDFTSPVNITISKKEHPPTPIQKPIITTMNRCSNKPMGKLNKTQI